MIRKRPIRDLKWVDEPTKMLEEVASWAQSLVEAWNRELLPGALRHEASLARFNATSTEDDYTMEASDELIYADATSGALTVTLSLTSKHRRVVVKKIDGTGNPVTVQGPAGRLIDGAASVALGAYGVVQIVNDGSAYWTV